VIGVAACASRPVQLDVSTAENPLAAVNASAQLAVVHKLAVRKRELCVNPT
jgi:hypothetical protein